MDFRFGYWKLWVLVLLPLTATKKDKDGGIVESRFEVCTNEGEPIVDNLTVEMKNCYFCKCKNGYIQCTSKYPPTDGCYLLTTKGHCKICQGCIYKGKSYPSGTEWTDPYNPCKVMRCEAGIVTVSEIQCHKQCTLPPEPGKCCGTCPVCQISGQTVSENRDVVTESDPCLKCRCSKGQMTCSKKACPVLQCHESHQVKEPGECCPKCNGTQTIIMPRHACPIQLKVYREGFQLQPDQCTNCKCLNNTSICTRKTCPILDCLPENQKTFQGHCCPICVRPKMNDYITTECQYAGRTYENDMVWKMDACSSCKCNNGQVSCARIRCNSTCESGMKTVVIPGECCPRCIENDGACMAFGDPHYKTFDGKIYTFRGIGKYQLIEDCQNHTFSIKVANELSSKYMNSAITKRVAINFGDIRLNLQQRMRVKYNGQKLTLPFKKEGRFRVKKERDVIEVRLQNDVVILWNGKSFLEVTVPPNYKGKLCGLCGNFNGDVQDDFKTKFGKIVNDTDLMSFGSSWCVGRKTDCAKKVKHNKRGYANFRHCQFQNHKPILSSCEGKLSSNKYEKACKIDMENCVHGRCYCESIMAYSRECERLGVTLSDWQRYLKCDAESFRRSSHQVPRPPKLPKNTSSASAELLRILKLPENTVLHTRKPIPVN